MASAAALAADALRLAPADPDRAEKLARDALAAAARDVDVYAQATRALGLAARERNDLKASAQWLRRSAAAAKRAGLTAREGEALVSLAFTYAVQNRVAAARAALEQAEPLAEGPIVRQVHAQRALLSARQGRFREALDAFDVAVEEARVAGDLMDEARFLNNRGLVHGLLGDLDASEADLRRAIECSGLEDDPLGVVAGAQNLGWLLGRKGDVPAALRALENAEPAAADMGIGLAQLLYTRADVLLGVRLVAEARETAARAYAGFREAGMHADAAEARLLLASAALLAGDAAAALADARGAKRVFLRTERDAWAALAGHVEMQALASLRRPSSALVRRALDTGDELARTGWVIHAMDANLAAAVLADAIGDRQTTAALASRAAAARDRGPADLRARAWHVLALARRAAGDVAGARRAVGSGLRIVSEYRVALGATELRAHSSLLGQKLADLGLELVLRPGAKAATVFSFIEQHRAQSLRLTTVRPALDPRVAEALRDLRAAVADVQEAVIEGDDARALLARQAEAERRVTSLVRTLRGGEQDTDLREPSLADIGQALGRDVLLEYVERAGELWVVVLRDGRASLHHLGPMKPIEADVAAVGFALRRLARPGLPAASQASARGSLLGAASRLDESLIPRAARRDRGTGERAGFVVVAAAELHGLVWPALPSMWATPHTIAPSAGTWFRTTRARGVDDRDHAPPAVVAIAGPDLPAAPVEVAAVTALHPGARALSGTQASVAAAVDALEGASIAHVAAHGHFRSDSPMFSALRLADGPLFVHDLESLAPAPDTVVLSACEVAQSGGPAADELLGALTALLSVGVRRVVASMVPVPDEATSRFMHDFHVHLAAGAPVAVALHNARGTRDINTCAADDLVSAMAFTAFGAGLSRG